MDALKRISIMVIYITIVVVTLGSIYSYMQLPIDEMTLLIVLVILGFLLIIMEIPFPHKWKKVFRTWKKIVGLYKTANDLDFQKRNAILDDIIICYFSRTRLGGNSTGNIMFIYGKWHEYIDCGMFDSLIYSTLGHEYGHMCCELKATLERTSEARFINYYREIRCDYFGKYLISRHGLSLDDYYWALMVKSGNVKREDVKDDDKKSYDHPGWKTRIDILEKHTYLCEDVIKEILDHVNENTDNEDDKLDFNSEFVQEIIAKVQNDFGEDGLKKYFKEEYTSL